MTDWQISHHQSISEIDADSWRRCADGKNPLCSYDFLYALEESGAASTETGWRPHHLCLADQNDLIHGVMPLYIKAHSYGEYVFDHSWAEAWHQAGGQYYPKAQVAIPFSPVPGRRFMLVDDADQKVFSAMVEGTIQMTNSLNLSSLHITFLTEEEVTQLGGEDSPWIIRQGMQFHWQNNAFENFDDFLGMMTSRKRKMIRRERREAASGIRFYRLTGDDLKPHHWDDFYRFYLTTIDKKWGGAYLTREFFAMIGETMTEQILLIMAEESGQMIAGALNFIGTDTLYGRNWGCAIERPFLHFENCYYQAIDFAIERGLQTVEAGAQGLHKIQRGYAPALTYSAHYIPHPEFARAIDTFTKQEAKQIIREAEMLQRWSPYRTNAEI